jgi:hypothetical protein
MSTPSGKIKVASVAASTDSVWFNGNRQPEDGFYHLERMDLIRHKSRKPRFKSRDEISSDLAVGMFFMEVFRRAIRVDAMPAIRTNKDHVLIVDNIWCAPEKIIIDNRMLIRQNTGFMHVQRSRHSAGLGRMMGNSRCAMICTLS